MAQAIDTSHIYESLDVIGGLKERLKKRENIGEENANKASNITRIENARTRILGIN